MSKITPPVGWNVLKVPPGPSSGEEDSHSKYVDPEGPYGAADSAANNTASYKNDTQETPEGEDPRTASQPPLQDNEVSVEHGNLNGRDYYLVYNSETEKYHVYIPDLEPGESFSTAKKATRAEALELAYKALNARLPHCALDQLRERMPESMI